MDNISIYHYVYRITNLVENKHYYGKRSSKIHPKHDIGVKYFSSSKDRNFIADQKSNPQNYKYKIIRRFENSKSALEFEVLLHNKFDVGRNVNFYNRAKQTSSGFDTTGTTGIPWSDDRKLEYSKRLKGISTGPQSIERRMVQSARQTGKKQSKPRTPEMREAQRQRILGTKQSESAKEAKRHAMLGMKREPWSEERKEQKRQQMKLSAPLVGKEIWNDGTRIYYVSPGHQKEGWVRGRIKKQINTETKESQ